MRIGMQPANSGPLATPALLAELVETADELGYHSCLVTDHVVLPIEYTSRYPYNDSGRIAAGHDFDFFEPLALIGWLAGRTSRIKLGTSVLIAPYRHPVFTAKYLSSLDVLCGGRLVIGLGVGWWQEEFAALDAPPFAERGAVTDEIIDVWRTIWREQPASFEGRYYRFPAAGAMPKPLQAGGIPLYIGGNSRPALRRATRAGDGWQPFKLTPDELQGFLPVLDTELARHGRPRENFTLSLRLGLRLTTTPTERRPAEEPWKTLVGTPDQVAQDIAVYQQLGVDEIVFDYRTCRLEEVRESLQLGGKELLPRFHG